MATYKLSPAQCSVLDPKVRVVEAGPGSGKTRALVARFLADAERCDGGVALLSFTNSAVDEVRARSGVSAAGITKAPNYVGTLDSFLHRFILTPVAIKRSGRRPVYRDTWDFLPDQLRIVRPRDVPGMGLPLAAFLPDGDDSVKLDVDALDGPQRKYLGDVEAAGQLAAAEVEANARIRGLMRGGTFDATWARWAVGAVLRSSRGEDILDRLATRFEALLVDEMQDCNDIELDLLKQLSAKGVTTLVVADPDQAIYEFRGSKPELFLGHRDSMPPEARVDLSENYRSTAAICAAVTALRAAGVSAIEPAVDAPCCPVYVLRGSTDEQRAKFLELLDAEAIGIQEAVVLAHARNDALRASGREAQKPTGASALGVRLAHAWQTLEHAPDPAIRREAMRDIEDVVLALMDWPKDHHTMSRSAKLDRLGVDSWWLRETAARLVQSLAGCSNRQDLGKRARASCAELLDGLALPSVDLSARLKSPPEAAWDSAITSYSGEPLLPADTVHGSKGREYPAVLLVVKPKKEGERTVLDDWEADANTEARRVLYVGASRAERLLAFGAGPHADRVESLLRAAGVPVEIL